MRIIFIKTLGTKAFTLAEVLITLLIIGVISSIVIPTLINDTQNQEFAVLFKKDFSTLSEATKKMMMDNGGTMAGFFADHNDMMNKFGNYISFTKKCLVNEQGCFYAGTNTWKNLNGNYGWRDHTNCATAIINNGGLIMFDLDRSDCQNNNGTGSPAEHSCGWVHIDVNGFKGPNTIGRDIFAAWVTKSGLYPFGTYNDWYSNLDTFCNKNHMTAQSGRGCAAVILSGEKID